MTTVRPKTPPPPARSNAQAAAARTAKAAQPSSSSTKKRGSKKGKRKKALGQDEPFRMCIVCRASKPQVELMRFARSPDGAIGFDIKAVLPGRGAWVCATTSCLEKATDAKHGGFARAFEEAVSFDGAAVRQNVRTLLLGDALARLGLLRRQGELVLGRDDVIRQKHRMAFVGLAVDLSANSLREVSEGLATPEDPTTTLPLPPMESLADALGTRAVGVVGVVSSDAADALAVALHKAINVGALVAPPKNSPPPNPTTTA